jgi:hypothetical protein
MASRDSRLPTQYKVFTALQGPSEDPLRSKKRQFKKNEPLAGNLIGMIL